MQGTRLPSLQPVPIQMSMHTKEGHVLVLDSRKEKHSYVSSETHLARLLQQSCCDFQVVGQHLNGAMCATVGQYQQREQQGIDPSLRALDPSLRLQAFKKHLRLPVLTDGCMSCKNGITWGRIVPKFVKIRCQTRTTIFLSILECQDEMRDVE